MLNLLQTVLLKKLHVAPPAGWTQPLIKCHPKLFSAALIIRYCCHRDGCNPVIFSCWFFLWRFWDFYIKSESTSTENIKVCFQPSVSCLCTFFPASGSVRSGTWSRLRPEPSGLSTRRPCSPRRRREGEGRRRRPGDGSDRDSHETEEKKTKRLNDSAAAPLLWHLQHLHSEQHRAKI